MDPPSAPCAIDLFSGIGGMALAVHAVADGLGIRAACDADPECRAVMRRRFGLAEDRLFADVRALDARSLPADLVYGGFPCQDVSVAGRGLGVELGQRSGLFAEMVRIAAEARSRFLMLENVSSLATHGLDHVLRVMAAAGWTEARAATLAVSEIGGRHQRRRIFILARNPSLPGGALRYRPRPDLARWLQETWAADTEPAPRLTEDTPMRGTWAAQVRMLGNTCVPQQGEVALRFLLGGLGEAGGADDAAATWDEMWDASAAAWGEGKVRRVPAILPRRARAQLCPTLVANDSQGGNQAARRPDGTYGSMTLARWVRHKPAADTWGMGGPMVPIRRRAVMNVRWAAWLMGFPEGWLSDVDIHVAPVVV
jgi:site-specific DNA-cytosine methylase